MSACRLTRRISLLLPFILAACGGEQPTVYRPLRYNYLKPIDMNVRTIDIEQRFVASGVTPDISGEAPIDPVATLRALGEDRLKPFGGTGRAVFSISDASLIRHGDLIRGSMEATVEILTDDGQHAGYAQARVSRRYSGHVGDLRAKLYELVSGMMDDMNVELEFQIRNHLQGWIVGAVTAAPSPVSAEPLASPSSPVSRP
jgi:hypothetical protein